MTKVTQPSQQDDKKVEKLLLDLHISIAIIEFANVLRTRFNIKLAECEQRQHELNEDDPDFKEDYDLNDGEHMGIRQCNRILTELVDAEVKDRKQYTLDKIKG